MQKLTLSLWIYCGLTTTLLAGTHKIPTDEPFATIVTPDKWPAGPLGEGVKADSPDGMLHLLAFPGEGRKVAETIGEMMRYLRGTGGITVRADSRVQETGKLNGRDVHYIKWEGKNEKGAIAIRFTVIFFGKFEPLVIAYWGSPAEEQKYQAELEKILQSVKDA